MFTTGSKFFLGATVLTTVAALLYGMTTGGQAGITGTIGLASAACALALLAGINYHTRDCNVSGVQQGGGAHTAASTVPPSRSFWPVTAALGGALLVIGADSYPVVFKIGIIVLLATGFEWLVQGWSDRASLDPAYNDSLRKRMMNPIEFPVLAAVGLGILVYSFSRIMLKLPKTAGPVLFVATGAAVVVAGFMLAAMPRAKKGVIAGIAAVAALGVIGVGAVSAIDGQRVIEEHPAISDKEFAEICEFPGEVEVVDEHTAHLAEIDEKAGQSVSILSSLAATVVLKDGGLQVFPLGLNEGTQEFQVARSNPVNIRFRNLESEARRFTVVRGEFTTGEGDEQVVERPVVCTPLVEAGSDGFLTLKFEKSSKQSSIPYTIHVPGVEGQEIVVVVP